MAVTSASSGIEPAIVSRDPQPVRTDVVPHPHLHAPRAGETASLLVDYRELFKLRVTLIKAVVKASQRAHELHLTDEEA